MHSSTDNHSPNQHFSERPAAVKNEHHPAPRRYPNGNFSRSPDGKMFATAAAEILLWDTASGKLLERLEGHSDMVINLSFSPDGKKLASASHEGVVLVWNLE